MTVSRATPVAGLALVLMAGWALAGEPAPADSRRPNIILVLADDLGWSELGCYGNGFNETPHLDQLAADGMRFTAAYAAAPVCSPTRAALLTGQYPARVGILDYLRPEDPPLSIGHVSLAERLQGYGYATGFIGKWHLTGYRHHGATVEIRAVDHGFDQELVTEIKGVGNGANFFPYVFRDQAISWTNVREQRLPGKEFLVDRMNLEAVEFIQQNHDRPFFLLLSHFAVHTILNGKPELVEKYRRKHTPGASTRTHCYLCQDQGLNGDADNHWAGNHNPHLAAMLESIDDGVGMIRNTLDELGLLRETLLVFTSDNGGEAPNVTSNAPLRGGKSQLYEGGIRVPLIVCRPGHIPPRSLCRQPTITMDLYPTFLEAAGFAGDSRQLLDGLSLYPLFENPDAPLARDGLYWHYPLENPHFLGGRSTGAIQRDSWKLIEFFETGALELYHLGRDPGETQNQAKDLPALAEELRQKLHDWRHTVGQALFPAPQETGDR